MGSFQIAEGTTSDDCDEADGVDAHAAYLNPTFPGGLFVCQDGFSEGPGTSAPLDLADGVA